MESEKTLVGKRVLFISVKFFNYENLIKKQLEELGAIVDWADERYSNTFFTKAMIRINKSFISRRIHQYFKKLMNTIKGNKYDYFLLLKGEATPKFFLDFLRENNPGIKFIFYTWDSFKNNKNGLDILDLFDYKFTFDTEDAEAYNLKLRPLFFVEEYAQLKNKEIKNDIAFIGTAHSDRYAVTEEVRRWCINNGFNMFAFYFSPSKLLFKFNKLFKKEFKLFDEDKISFKSLSHQEIMDIYSSSNVILDINHYAQKGLTMRTFEVLGAGKKLITTNQEIKRYPFYDQQNILVINRKNIQLDAEFLKTEFRDLNPELLENMSLKGFITEIFGITKSNYWVL